MKEVVAAFNQEKALVGAFSVITTLRMQFGCNFLRVSSVSTVLGSGLCCVTELLVAVPGRGEPPHRVTRHQLLPRVLKPQLQQPVAELDRGES